MAWPTPLRLSVFLFPPRLSMGSTSPRLFLRRSIFSTIFLSSPAHTRRQEISVDHSAGRQCTLFRGAKSDPLPALHAGGGTVTRRRHCLRERRQYQRQRGGALYHRFLLLPACQKGLYNKTHPYTRHDPCPRPPLASTSTRPPPRHHCRLREIQLRRRGASTTSCYSFRPLVDMPHPANATS